MTKKLHVVLNRPEVVELLVREYDRKQIAKGLPIISVMLCLDDYGNPSKPFWESVRRYNLRKPGESDKDLIIRCLREIANARINHREMLDKLENTTNLMLQIDD